MLALTLNCGNVLGSVKTAKPFSFPDVQQDFHVIDGKPATFISHLTYYPGVTSEGVCENVNCAIRGKIFRHAEGYGLYRVMEDGTKCPSCWSQCSSVRTFGFSDCRVRMRFKRAGESLVHTREVKTAKHRRYFSIPVSTQNYHVKYDFIEVLSWPLESRNFPDVFEECKSCRRYSETFHGCQHCVNVINSDATKAIENIKDSLSEVKGEMKKMMSDQEELLFEVKHLVCDNKSTQSEVPSLLSEKLQLELDVLNLAGQEKKLQCDVRKLKSDKEGLTSEVLSIQDSVQQFKEDKNTLQATISKLVKDESALLTRIQALQSDMRDLLSLIEIQHDFIKYVFSIVDKFYPFEVNAGITSDPPGEEGEL